MKRSAVFVRLRVISEDLLFRILTALLLGLVLRMYFALTSSGLLSEATLSQLLKAVAVAVRFDLSTFFSYFGVGFLVWIWILGLGARERVVAFWRFALLAIALVLVGIQIVDYELFQIQGRLNGISSVVFALEYFLRPWVLVRENWLQLMTFCALAVGLSAIDRRLAKRLSCLASDAQESAAWPVRRFPRVVLAAGLSFVLIAVSVIAIRGGFQRKPLGAVNAADAGSERLATLALNTPYLLLRSVGQKKIARVNDFPSEEQLWAALEAEEPTAANAGILKGQNVVLIVLESFGREYMGWRNPWKGATPFLDSLASRSRAFANGYANGVRSIDFPPAILAGIPSLLDESYIKSVYGTNRIHGLPETFRRVGYQTAFYHGGGNGTMYFDSFTQFLGCEKYFGLNEYPFAERDFDGTWGIFDGPYFQYFAQQITEATQRDSRPFFFTIFSLSSHHPYTLPKGFAAPALEGDNPILPSISYADDSLRRFFETAEKEPWFSNTLFVITGDHTSLITHPEYRSAIGHYRVPILYYHPRVALPAVDAERVTQHADIPASLIDLFGLQAPKTAFGHSVFRANSPLVINQENGGFWIAENRFVLHRLEDGSELLFDHRNDPMLKEPLAGSPEVKERLAQRLKAHLQYFHNGLIDGSLYRASAISESRQ